MRHHVRQARRSRRHEHDRLARPRPPARVDDAQARLQIVEALLGGQDAQERRPAGRSRRSARRAACRRPPRARRPTSPGRLKRTCPSTTRWSIVKVYPICRRGKTVRIEGCGPSTTDARSRADDPAAAGICRPRRPPRAASATGRRSRRCSARVGASEQEVAHVTLTDLDTATRVLADALSRLPPPRTRDRAAPKRPRRSSPPTRRGDELAAVRIAAAEALLGPQPPAAAHRPRTAGAGARGRAARRRRRPPRAPPSPTRIWATRRAPPTRGARWAISNGWRPPSRATSSARPPGGRPSTPSGASTCC